MLLDITLGILAAYAAAGISDATLSGWHLVAAGVLANLPDLDGVWLWLKKREVAAHAGNPADHRDGLHWPLIYIPTVTTVGYIGGGDFWGALAFLCSFLHFVHDSVGTGWGVKWLRPFSEKSFKCFCEKDGTLSLRPLVWWEQDELKETIIQHGDPNWIQNLFTRPLWRAVTFQEIPPLGLTLLLTAEVVVPIVVIGVTAYRWSAL